MIATISPYKHVYTLAATTGLSLSDASIVLVDEDYTFDEDHTDYTDIQSNVVAGTLKSISGTISDITGGIRYDANDVTWVDLVAQFAHAVIYSPSTEKLIGCITFAGGYPITVTEYDFVLQWSASGIAEVRV
jgi:hypothetical protein